MIKRVYVVYNPKVQQEVVDSISVNKFKEMAKESGESFQMKDFVNKVINEGWDKTKMIAKVIEEKDVSSLDYAEFTSKEINQIRKSGFPNANGLDLICLKTPVNKIKIAKYYGGIFCLTYYDATADLLDSILIDNIDELCAELKFFASEKLEEY